MKYSILLLLGLFSTFSVVMAQQIELVNTSDSLKPYIKETNGDDGIRKLKITLKLTGKSKDNVNFKLKLRADSTRSKLVLLDSIIIIKPADFKTKQLKADLRIQLKELNCLPQAELFEIVAADDKPSKNIEGKIKVTISPNTKTTTRPTYTLLDESTTVRPFLKSEKNYVQPTLMMHVTLTGKRDSARDVLFKVVSPPYIKSSSDPKQMEETNISIPQKSFSEDGCPVKIQIVVPIKLSPVEKLEEEERIPFITSLDEKHAHILIIRQDTIKSPVKNTSPSITPKKGYSFTHACTDGRNFTIVLQPDSLGGKVLINEEKRMDTFVYKYNYFFRAEIFGEWFLNIYTTQVDPRSWRDFATCANQLSGRVYEELTNLKEVGVLPAPSVTASLSAGSLKATAEKESDSLKAPVSTKTDKPKDSVKNDAGDIKKLKAYFIQDTFRLKASSKMMDTITLKARVPKDQALKKGEVSVDVDKDKSTADLGKLARPFNNSFKLGDLKDTLDINYLVTVPRDGEDDRQVVFALHAKDSSGKAINFEKGDTTAVVYIKPPSSGAYDTLDWKDGKSAEVFVGTNFDFIDNKVSLSDWYGGARVFLPGITNAKYNKGKNTELARFGFAGGIYHAKSLSNFGNPSNNEFRDVVYGRITDYFADSAVVRYDTVNVKVNTEINNWGLYFTPLFHLSRFESDGGKFITNIYGGLHMEVIRRNVRTEFVFDSSGTETINYKLRQIPRSAAFTMPQTSIQTFYDAYYGICTPVQFLWKDILDVKINPCLGIGSRAYTSQIVTKADERIKKSPFFYLIQFDLLARLGGLRLNIGGEVRGYLPNENPIITSYLGTSFTIQKLIDFITK